MHKLRFFACFCLASAVSKTFFIGLLETSTANQRSSSNQEMAQSHFYSAVFSKNSPEFPQSLIKRQKLSSIGTQEIRNEADELEHFM